MELLKSGKVIKKAYWVTRHSRGVGISDYNSDTLGMNNALEEIKNITTYVGNNIYFLGKHIIDTKY